ncbi:MAG: uroporphyrinogen decarboxylase family protein [Cellulosilyticaceae bacterium]
MNNRERVKAILHYQNYDRMPVVHFGYWYETLEKWYHEGHITEAEWKGQGDGNEIDKQIANKLGFDFNWQTMTGGNAGLYPHFERTVIEELTDGSKKVMNYCGVIELEKPGIISIPQEFDHTLKDRKSWENYFLPKLKYTGERINFNTLEQIKKSEKDRENPLGLHCGSLFGEFRNWVGVEGASYMYADDEELFEEILHTIGELSYEVVKNVLSSGTKFDFAHFWEDICFKNGPLVIPTVFDEKVGPYYRKITDLLKENGIEIISLDCDGMIDSLIPTWLENGINTMFPIEVGTWEASIKPWREKYGKTIRGVGGMNKNIFARDYRAIDKEVERLKSLIALGGYIPCPDHRIPPDAKWENVQYYCEKMRNI